MVAESDLLADRLALHVPDRLRGSPFWLVWKYVRNPDKPKPDKVPYYARTGTVRNGVQGSPEDRAGLAPFDVALAAFRSGDYSGVGQAMLGAGVTALDFDQCIAEDGTIDPEVRELVRDTYAERSPSGRGIRAFYLGEMPDRKRDAGKSGGLEVFCASGYVTVTGDAIGAEDVAPLPDAVRSAIEKRLGRKEKAADGEAPPEVPASTLRDLRSALAAIPADDRDLWVKLGHALKPLGDAGRGLWIEWSQTSEKYDPADAGSKWASFHTIATDYRAVFAEAKRHGWQGPSRAPASEKEVPPITVASARLPPDWVEAEQPPPPFIVPGLLPEAEAGSLVGPGGTCKSTMKLYESVHLILGRALYGRRVLKPGAVLAISKEDRAELIDYRLKQICRGLGLSKDEMHRVHSHFLRLVLRSDSFALQRIGIDRIPFRSGDVAALIETFQGEGIVSAWFDTVSRFATGEGNEEAKVTVDAATLIADAWQCAVELLHHVSQNIARTGTVDMHSSRGGTAFIDNGRFARQLLRHAGDLNVLGAVGYCVPEGLDPQAELIRMHIVKLTGARYDIHAPIWIERREEWQFVCAEGASGGLKTREDRQAEARGEQATADDAAVLGFIREHLAKHPPRRLTQNALVESRERIVRGMSAHRVRDAVGRLRLDGVLIDVDLPDKVVRGQRTFLAPAGWQESVL